MKIDAVTKILVKEFKEHNTSAEEESKMTDYQRGYCEGSKSTYKHVLDVLRLYLEDYDDAIRIMLGALRQDDD